MISQVHLGSERNFTVKKQSPQIDSSSYEYFLLVAEISAALWVHILTFEITLRNFIHSSLRAIYKNNTWWLIPGLLFKGDAEVVGKVIRRLSHRKIDQTEGIFLSNLSFSFWIELLSKRYHQKIWNKLLKYFPVYPGRREEFHRKAREIRNLRNSIAHHGPILRRNLLRDLAYLNELTSLLNPTLAIEVEKRSRALELIQNAQLVGSGGGI